MGSKSSKIANDKGDGKPQSLMAQERKCRDCFCIPIFLACWAGMIFMAILGYQYGDPARLLYGIDYMGNNCGSATAECHDGPGSCGQFLTFPRMDEDLYRAQQQGVLNDPTKILTFPFFGVCRKGCPEGVQDVNGDGEIDNWICTYDTLSELNSLYGINTVSSEIPSSAARYVLEECLVKKANFPFLSYLSLSTTELLPNGDTANCQKYMEDCSKMFAQEKDLFFKCIPITEENSTCTRSPFLEYYNRSVSTLDGTNTNRPASDPHCGECLDPVEDTNGAPMDPGSSSCRAKKVFASSEATVAAINPVFASINDFTSILQQWLGDVYITWWQITVCGAVLPIGLGAVWLLLLRLFAKTFVMIILWGLFFGLTFLSLQFLIYGNVITATMLSDALDALSNATGIVIDSMAVSADITNVDVFGTEAASQEQAYAILGWVMTGITVIYLLLLIVLYRRIRIAIAVIREATKCVAVMPLIMLFPIVTVAITLVLMFYWCYIGLYLVTMGNLETILINHTDTGRRLDATGSNITSVKLLSGFSYVEWIVIFHCVGILWTTHFVSAIGSTTIAGAVGSWYWASPDDKEKAKKMPRFPIIKSLKRVLRYHLGSLLFGSFIITVVQVIRAILMYIDKQTAALQKKNRLVRILMKVMHCCLWCLEKILKFITKNAYIMIALFGKSFCTSTKDAFLLIIGNIGRIGTATALSNLVILCGRLLIVTAVAFILNAILTLTATGAAAPSSVVLPTIVTIILSWYVSGCFLGVYGLTIDTIMVSFCVDDAKNDGSPEHPYYMTRSLRKITNKWNKQAQRKKEANLSDDEDDVRSPKASTPAKAAGGADIL